MVRIVKWIIIFDILVQFKGCAQEGFEIGCFEVGNLTDDRDMAVVEWSRSDVNDLDAVQIC